MKTEHISLLLKDMGLSGKYVGHGRMVTAIELALEEDLRLTAVVREIYVKIGELHQCTWYAAEHSLRTGILIIWNRNAGKLCGISGLELPYPPTTSEFLDIMVTYIQRTETR